MVHKDIHHWICEYVFQNNMHADRNEMAMKLRISERMLNRALKRGDSFESRLVFELCLRYCSDHGIDINEAFRIYFHNDE